MMFFRRFVLALIFSLSCQFGQGLNFGGHFQNITIFFPKLQSCLVKLLPKKLDCVTDLMIFFRIEVVAKLISLPLFFDRFYWCKLKSYNLS